MLKMVVEFSYRNYAVALEDVPEFLRLLRKINLVRREHPDGPYLIQAFEEISFNGKLAEVDQLGEPVELPLLVSKFSNP